MNRSKMPKFLRAAALAAAVSLAPVAWADDFGSDLRDGQWVQWIYSIPTSVNPMIDDTGRNCMVGQNGSTWYLAPLSVWEGGEASRSCTIPQGVKLQFAVAGATYVYAPGFCGDVAGTSDRDLRADIAAFTDTLRVNVTLDGERVSAKRLRSEVFATALPADNLFALSCDDGPGSVPAGIYRTVDDTYYAEIENLRPGAHTLRLVATDGSSFHQNVVYTLNVVPRLRR